MIKYFYTDGKVKYGPFSREELRNQNISRSTMVWFYGLDEWKELSEIPELYDVLSSIPPDLKFDNGDIKDKKESHFNSNSKKKIKRPFLTKYSFSSGKWVFIALATVVVALWVYDYTQNRSDINLYNEVVENSYDGDGEFDIYLKKFYRDLSFYGIYPKKPEKTIIKFSKLDQIDKTTHIHGLSYGVNDDDKIEIYINPSTWDRFNKPMRYFLMYHELSHDVLNLEDLEAKTINKGKLMYPEISNYENINMDEFIESFDNLFENLDIKGL